MTTDRPYRKRLSVEEARRRLRDAAGQQFDPQVVEVFLALEAVARRARRLAHFHELDALDRTASRGRSLASRSTSEMASTTSMPSATRPKTVCLPSSQGGLGGDDEELAPVRVRAAVGHGQSAADDAVVVRLVLELVAGPPVPSPAGNRPGS